MVQLQNVAINPTLNSNVGRANDTQSAESSWERDTEEEGERESLVKCDDGDNTLI